MVPTRPYRGLHIHGRGRVRPWRWILVCPSGTPSRPPDQIDERLSSLGLRDARADPGPFAERLFSLRPDVDSDINSRRPDQSSRQRPLSSWRHSPRAPWRERRSPLPACCPQPGWGLVVTLSAFRGSSLSMPPPGAAVTSDASRNIGLLVTEQRRRALLRSMAQLARRSNAAVVGTSGSGNSPHTNSYACGTGTAGEELGKGGIEAPTAIFPTEMATPIAPPARQQPSVLPPPVPSLENHSSGDGGLNNPVAANDTATDESIMFAVALLRRLQQSAEVNELGEASVTMDEVDQILQGFSKALESVSTTWDERRVEDTMQKLFVSHANVFDESMQNFFIQNFLHESDCAKTYRTALRRTSMLRRCLLSMYPAEKSNRTLAAKRWSAAIAHVTQKDPPAGAVDDFDVADPLLLQTIRAELGNIQSWDFNVFAIADHMPGQVLTVVGKTLLEQYDFSCHFRSSKARLCGFLHQIELKYYSHPYHNSTHAADVTQTLHYFLQAGEFGDWFSPRTKCAAILAAIIHDVGHTSYTNNFHIAINDDLAVQYVYRSPLEHMHCALAFQLLKDANYNILEGLSKIEQLEVRNLITDMVLATDNSVHSAYLAKLESLVRRTRDESWKHADPDDEKLLLQMTLHAADVSNPSKPMHICKRWAKHIQDEFYLQGDRERELTLPVSVGYDRQNPIPMEKIQAGFIIGIVRPLFSVMSQLPKIRLAHCVAQLDENLGYWQQEIERNQPKPQTDTA